MSSSTIRMLYREEKCDATSPGQQKFVDHNNKKLNATMTVSAERQRSNRFYIRKMTTFRGCNMILFSHTRFMEYVNPTQFFSTLRSNPFRFNQRKLRSMKFETVQIHFLSEVFGLLSSRNFARMAT